MSSRSSLTRIALDYNIETKLVKTDQEILQNITRKLGKTIKQDLLNTMVKIYDYFYFEIQTF